MEFIVEEYSTFYKIKKQPTLNLYDLKKALSTRDFMNNVISYAYTEYPTMITIPKIDRETLKKNINGDLIFQKMSDMPCKPIKFKMINKPKDGVQEEVIEKVLENFKTDNQTIVTLQTGQGKTYIATNIISQLKTKALILVQRDTLRKQWYESFKSHTNCKNVVTLKGTTDLQILLEEDEYYDVYITTHASIRNFINEFGIKNFNLLLLKHGIGIKVYDEFDMETKSMFYLDTHTNIQKTLYLSATDFKSSKSDQAVFKRVFGDMKNIGKEYYKIVDRDAIIYLYNSQPTDKERKKCYRYMYHLRESKFDKQRFHLYQMGKKSLIDIMDLIWKGHIRHKLGKGHRFIFFIGRIDPAEGFKTFISDRYRYDINNIGIFNSSVSKKDKEKEIQKEIIISTSLSLGRGVDMDKLDTVVDLETRSSKSEFAQVVGRISRTGGVKGTYIMVVDKAFEEVFNNFRNKKYKDYFSNIKINDLTEGGDFDG